MNRPRVLFVCVRNAGRSQMAAAFARVLGGDRVEVLSAGSEPADAIHPHVRAVMREVGVDLSGARPRRLTEDSVRVSDVVVTMGCGDACRQYPGKRHENWEIEDPEGAPIGRVREIRDSIADRVRRLMSELTPPRGSGVPRP